MCVWVCGGECVETPWRRQAALLVAVAVVVMIAAVVGAVAIVAFISLLLVPLMLLMLQSQMPQKLKL